MANVLEVGVTNLAEGVTEQQHHGNQKLDYKTKIEMAKQGISKPRMTNRQYRNDQYGRQRSNSGSSVEIGDNFDVESGSSYDSNGRKKRKNT